ncbi:hypothetical protein C496_18793 [Natronorubrum tibetense GA33]|uniref:Uncharacterized protein n=1 Tax=Natronorubrum tibetense GA33 TaxID=1114856 RepID=L9VLC5_9EURY|nr:hypothetical protein C496_18793 [Natronorubrum tibetense GA33]
MREDPASETTPRRPHHVGVELRRSRTVSTAAKPTPYRIGSVDSFALEHRGAGNPPREPSPFHGPGRGTNETISWQKRIHNASASI